MAPISPRKLLLDRLALSWAASCLPQAALCCVWTVFHPVKLLQRVSGWRPHLLRPLPSASSCLSILGEGVNLLDFSTSYLSRIYVAVWDFNSWEHAHFVDAIILASIVLGETYPVHSCS